MIDIFQMLLSGNALIMLFSSVAFILAYNAVADHFC